MKHTSTRYGILLLFCLISYSGIAQKLNLLIGTYTKPGKSEGIYIYEFDQANGKATYKNKATGLTNPSYLAVSKDEKYVYAVNEAGPGKGAINAFSYDKKTGELKLLNSQSTVGDGPCYVAVDDKNNHVFAANYVGGSAVAIALNRDGSLSNNVQHIKYQGGSVNQERQKSPHAHSSVLSTDNKFLFVSDLGTDKINVYEYRSGSQKEPLINAEPAYTQVSPGGGPRHFDFHPNGKFAYSLQEMSGNISVFKHNNGNLSLIENVSALPAGYAGRIWAADIHVSPDGKFLYSSNRDELNDIAIFKINQSTGRLNFVGRQSTLGNAPRNFVIDPLGNYLLAANQNSANIVIFKIDKNTGMLSDTGERIEVDSPVCLKFSKN